MIRITIVPLESENLYSLMVKKELDLRKRNIGTLHRTGKKKKDEDKWFHTSKNGWIKFKRSLGEIVVVTIQSKNTEKEWELLTAFVGFIYRHFNKKVRTISLDLKK